MSTSAKIKSKPSHTMGIAAGAEDVKYQAKYKELKRKVKEIELDNDRLQFKVMQAKRQVQRMKLERAILYERLAAVPPSPELNSRILPNVEEPPAAPSNYPPPHQHSQSNRREPHPPIESDRSLIDFAHSHPNPNSRIPAGYDSRQQSMDVHPGPTVSPSYHTLPPIQTSQPSRRRIPGGGGREHSHHMEPLPSLPPVQHFDAPPPRGHTLPPAHNNPQHHPHDHLHPHERSTSERPRGHQQYHPGSQRSPYAETLPPVQQQPLLSSPVQRGSGPSRRHDIHELTHHDQPHRTRHPRQDSGSPILHPSPSSRVHNHQRVGPGAYINRAGEEAHERELEIEREGEWERARPQMRERDRDFGGPIRSFSHSRGMEREHEHLSTSRSRDDPYVPPARQSREPRPQIWRHGDSSNSGSASGGPTEEPAPPENRSQFGSFRLRPVVEKSDVIDFVHEDGRGSRSERRRLSSTEDSHGPPRKRLRNDMDVDTEYNAEHVSDSRGRDYPRGHLPEDRGSNRFHPTDHEGGED